MTQVVYMKPQIYKLKESGQINIHPRANAVISARYAAALRQRNQHIKSINQDGVLAWKRTSGYYRQSEVENLLMQQSRRLGKRSYDFDTA